MTKKKKQKKYLISEFRFAVIGKTTDSKKIEIYFDKKKVVNIPIIF